MNNFYCFILYLSFIIYTLFNCYTLLLLTPNKQLEIVLFYAHFAFEVLAVIFSLFLPKMMIISTLFTLHNVGRFIFLILKKNPPSHMSYLS